VIDVFNVGPTNVEIVFSKPVAVTNATNAANYAFTNGVAITGAALAIRINYTVTLTNAPLVYGSNYAIVINNIRDRPAPPIPSPPTPWSVSRPRLLPRRTLAVRPLLPPSFTRPTE
jgi:hypothetical protein